MKKILSLTLTLGLLGILFFNLTAYLQVKAASTRPGEELVQNGPPWFDPTWNYRRPVVVTNSLTTLPYYQVLIKLDNSNFNFDRAQPDGDDIRFTHSDGTTELKYWLEDWNSASKQAYLWVRVPSLANGENTIYLYYGNPAADSASNGNTTFDGFDDNWGQFSGGQLLSVENSPIFQQSDEISSPFVWTVIAGNPTVSDGILTLADGSGIKTNSTYQYQAVGMKANYSLGSLDEWIGFINGTGGPRTIISDEKPGNLNDLFLVDTANSLDFEYLLLPKYSGQNWHGNFHTFELRWKADQSNVLIDHSTEAASVIPERVPSTNLPVTLYNDVTSNGTLKVDWVYLRQYRDPEPTSVVKAEQGLVELGVTIADSPDPVRKGLPITYQLTIANNASINATGVVVTDTLPLGIDLMNVDSSQGSCEPGSIIVCQLLTIDANAEAWVSIVISATQPVTLTNIAAVGSPGYEIDLSNNLAEEFTIIDWTPPAVNWEKPVKNAGSFLAFGGPVRLEASAADNIGIDRVEFLLWDHRCGVGDPPPGCWVNIGSSGTYPYHVQLDSSILAVNDPYQVFAVAVDQAGNISPWQRIFIERKLPVYLPVLRK